MKIKVNLSIILLITLIYVSQINAFADVDMEEGLYARYSFERFNHTIGQYDSQNNAQRLIEHGNPTIHYSNILGIGNYIYFDGDDYLRDESANGIVAEGASSFDVDQFTIVCVARTDYDVSSVAYVTINEVVAYQGFYAEWIAMGGNTNKTRIFMYDSISDYSWLWSDIELNATGWHLITWTWKAGEYVRIWHNTTLALNHTSAFIVPHASGWFDVQRCVWNGYYGEGDIGFVELYTQAVNQDWVTEKYNSVFGIDVITPSVDMSDMLFDELLFGAGFWFGLLLVIAILQVVCSIVPSFSSLGGIFSFLLFIAYIMNMDLNGWHVFGIMLMAVNGVYLFLQSSE